MADTRAPASSTAKGGGAWFTRKIGPLPAWGWGALAVGAYYWYTHYGPGAKQAAARPAGATGARTYAPHITETIYEGGGQRRRRRRPPRAAAAATAAAAAGGPNRPPGRKPPPPPPPPPQPAPVPVPPQPAAAQAPTGGPVNADTGQPVFLEWQHAHRGPDVPMPVAAYAPMTNGATYDAASAGADLAAG